MIDIVGNNIPVFFIQDAIQFPDLIHAVKPRPNNEIPQAATAHDEVCGRDLGLIAFRKSSDIFIGLGFLLQQPFKHAYPDVGHVWPWNPSQLQTYGRLWRPYLPFRGRRRKVKANQISLQDSAGPCVAGLARGPGLERQELRFP